MRAHRLGQLRRISVTLRQEAKRSTDVRLLGWREVRRSPGLISGARLRPDLALGEHGHDRSVTAPDLAWPASKSRLGKLGHYRVFVMSASARTVNSHQCGWPMHSCSHDLNTCLVKRPTHAGSAPSVRALQLPLRTVERDRVTKFRCSSARLTSRRAVVIANVFRCRYKRTPCRCQGNG